MRNALLGALLFCPRRLGWITAALACLAAAGEVRASEPAIDTSFLRAHAETRGFSLGRPTHVQPTPDGLAVLFLRAPAREPKMALYEFDVATAKTSLLVTPEQVLQGTREQLSPEEKARRERQRVSGGGFTGFQLSPDGRQVLLNLSGKLYLFERDTRQLTPLKTGVGTPLDPKFSPDGKYVAYVLDQDVRVLEVATQQERPVTQGGTAAVSHGLAEFVAQEEMDRFSGYWWSPDSRFIAYEEADATEVEIWHVADAAHPEQAAWRSYYPRPGKANVKARLGVAPITGGQTVWLQWDQAKYPYLATVRWDEHGPLTLGAQTRDQRELALLQADPATGKTTPLLVERDAAWVGLRQDIPQWISPEKGFLWASESVDDWRVEWRDPQGGLRQVLVPPAYHFQSFGHVDRARGCFYFNARPDPTQSQVYRLAFDGGTPVALTSGRGFHQCVFAKNSALYAHQSSLLDSPPAATVYHADGAKVGDLPSVAEPAPFIPRVELTRVGRSEGFYTGLVRPQKFSSKKRYPVIVNVYGGPLPPGSHGMVSASLPGWLTDQWLADQGFIVVRIDGRGSPGRNHDWERAIARHFDSVPLDDQVAALTALGQKYPELDLKRVGIVGWSFGGYLSALAALKRPDVFKAAVAGAPPVDWLDYDTHYTERYLGLPQTDANAYEAASLLTYAPQLSRPLLIIHGTADDNVYFRHALRLADALFRAGKPFEFLPLSGSTHMTPNPVVAAQKWTRITRFFQQHLGGPK